MILACTVAVWLRLSFPRAATVDEHFDAQITAVTRSLLAGEERDQRIAALESERVGEALRPAAFGRAEIVVGLLRPPGTSAQRESSRMR